MEFSASLFERRITRALTRSGRGTSAETSHAANPATGSTIDVGNLCSIADDRQFVDEAYSRILGRDCDLVSLANCLEMLGAHTPRRVLLLQLVNSDEAKLRGVVFTGLPQAAAPPEGHRSIFEKLKQRLTGRLVDVSRRIVFARFDAINHKLNFLLRAVEVRTDDLSARTDRGIVAISEKLEANFADLREQVPAQLIKRVTALATQVEDTEARLSQEFSKEFSAVRTAVSDVQSQLPLWEQRYKELLKAFENLEDRLTVKEAVPPKAPAILLGGNNILATEVDGFILGVPAEEWRLAAHYAFRGVLEPGLTKHFRSLVKPGMVVVDVGANIGIFTLDGARLLQGDGKVHSFEPTPRTFDILKDNVQVNGFLETNVVVLHRVAVTDKEGQAPLSMFPADCGHNTLFGDNNDSSRLTVPTVSLDQALCEESRVDVVKIDAEGAEPFILRGMKGIIARNPAIRILLEFAPSHLRRAGFDPESFWHEIHAMNLRVLRIDDQSGELAETSCDQLVNVFSANLDLTTSHLPKEVTA